MDPSADFADRFGFALDDFQLDGIRSLTEGRSVLVAAPTGAGKTVVGEYAVWRALRDGRRAFYTTPIKALSNQKYHELAEAYGTSRVGLLTGDRSVNGDAPVVVMTTEVLRNMLYEDSPALHGLQAVVLDEVHYLSDVERGAVWEEVIIQLPRDVQLACLSATVSNAEEFGLWLASVRGDGEGVGCDVVITEERPVPLSHHYAYDDRVEPMFMAGGRKSGRKPSAARVAAAKQARGGVPNPDIVMRERRSAPSGRRSRRGRAVGNAPNMRPPRRSQLVRALEARRWLPAIVFVFSRNGCDAAVAQLLRDGIRLTSADERHEIRRIVAEHTTDLPPEDLAVLGFETWSRALTHGVAAHHAGMVPAFKETVEALFVRGLLKVCFATETLALGINMPARTVVVERLEKWDGQRHALLSPGQFTQLTGRAGRRGLDERGYAVVLHQRDVDFPTVASLVGRRVEPLTSRFQPSYNMAVNVLRHHGRNQAEALLARSFAQWQADAHVAGDLERVARNRAALEGYAANLVSEIGDAREYLTLRRRLADLQRRGAKERRVALEEATSDALAALQPGDVAQIDGGELIAVIGIRRTRADVPVAEAVTAGRHLVRIGPRELSAPPERLGRIELPTSGGPRQAAYRRTVAHELSRIEVPSRRRQDTSDGERGRAAEIATLQAAVTSHPVAADPRRADIETWGDRYDELAAETARIERKAARRTGSLVARFERIVDILTAMGYLEDHDGDPYPTASGIQLARLYAETDLVLTEAIRAGLLHGLDDAELAAVVSCFTFETRAREPAEPELPTAVIVERVDAVERLWEQIAHAEDRAGVPTTRAPDAGFASVVWRWASGADLDDALDGEDMTGGDFVRGTKQVADLLRQIRDAVDDAELAGQAQRANKALMRGVVAHTGV